MSKTLHFSIAAVGALLLAACGGARTGAPLPSSAGMAAGRPAQYAQDEHRGHGEQPPTVQPSKLDFTALGANSAQTFDACVQFSGKLTAVSSNPSVATVDPATAYPRVRHRHHRNGGDEDGGYRDHDRGTKCATFTVTPVANGSATITVTDKKGGSATVAVTVNALTYEQVVLADHPWLYYRLDLNPANSPSGSAVIADVSGNNRNALISTRSFTSVPGALLTSTDTALQFTYFGGRIVIPEPAPVTSSYSVEAWIKTSSAETFTIQSALSDSTSAQLFFSVGTPVSPPAAAPGQLVLGIGGHGAFANAGVLSNLTVNDGKWHHVVGTWAGVAGSPVTPSQFHIYVDGVDATGAPFGTGNLGLTAPLSLDKNSPQIIENAPSPQLNFADPNPIDLDEYAVYDYALTPSQIQAHYHAAGY